MAVFIKKPFTAKKSDAVFDVSKMMVRGGFRRLPVVEDGVLVGIITPSDILHHLYSKKKDLRKDRIPIKQIMKKSVITVTPKTRMNILANYKTLFKWSEKKE